MFCKKCGTPLENGAKFCPKCGANLSENLKVPETRTAPEAPAAANTTYAPANPAFGNNTQTFAQNIPNQNPAYAPAPENPNPAFSVNTPSAMETAVKTAKKGSKKWLKVLLSVGIPVVAIVTAAAILFTTGVFDKWFAKDVKTVEKNSSEKFFESAADTYEKALFETKEVYLNGKYDIGIELSDTLCSLLETATGVDFSWAKSLSMDYSVSASDKYIVLSTQFYMNETQLINGDMAFDLSNDTVYFSYPGLFEKSMKLNLGSFLGDMSSSDLQALEAFKLIFGMDLSKYLPSGDTVEKLLNKYFTIILDTVGEPVETEEKVTAEGITQNMRIATYHITEETALKVCKNVLTEAKNDSDIKNIIKNAEGLVKELEDALDEELLYGDIYEEYQEGVSELLEDIEDYTASDDAIDISVYIAKNDVVGLKLSYEGATLFEYVEAKKGGKFGVDGKLLADDDYVTIRGYGTYSGNEYTGTLTVSAQDVNFTVTFEDFSNENGKINGKISIPFDQFMPSEGEDLSMQAQMLSGCSVDVTFDSSNGGISERIDFLMGGEPVITMTCGFSPDPTVSADSYTAPSNAVEVNDMDDFEEWAMTLDYNALLDKLSDAGITDQLIDALGEELFGFGGLSDFGDFGYDDDDYWDYDDYDYDYDYDYEDFDFDW